MKYVALILSAAALALSGVVSAAAPVDVGKGMKGRPYHQMVYEDGCDGCHTGSPKKYVDDASCRDCHGSINEIEIDVSQLKMPEANPHKSVHYNQGASCIACHGEHETKAPVCSECHRTWFEEF